MTDTAMTIFDLIKTVSHTKKDVIAENVKLYNPYLVNRSFSQFSDTILHANEMNMRHGLDKEMQYHYYMGALRAKNRYGKWAKTVKDDRLDLIQEVYGVRREIAKQYSRVLTDDDIETLKNINKKDQQV